MKGKKEMCVRLEIRQEGKKIKKKRSSEEGRKDEEEEVKKLTE